MELRKFYGKSGRAYYVIYSPETYWKVFIETIDGFELTKATAAAVDCGSPYKTEGEDRATTHQHWGPLWRLRKDNRRGLDLIDDGVQ